MTWEELQEAAKRARAEVRRTRDLLSDAKRAHESARQEADRIEDLILVHKEPA